MVIGFNSGIVIGIATGKFKLSLTLADTKKMTEELHHIRNFKDSLDHMAVSYTMNQLATCGDDSIKVHDLNDLKDILHIITLEEDRGHMKNVEWSEDGQFLTLSTST